MKLRCSVAVSVSVATSCWGTNPHTLDSSLVLATRPLSSTSPVTARPAEGEVRREVLHHLTPGELK